MCYGHQILIKELYYTDTDSLDFKGVLDSKYISNKIGDWKEEFNCERALYLAPKLYCLEYKKNDKTQLATKARGLKNPESLIFNQLLPILSNFLAQRSCAQK